MHTNTAFSTPSSLSNANKFINAPPASSHVLLSSTQCRLYRKCSIRYNAHRVTPLRRSCRTCPAPPVAQWQNTFLPPDGSVPSLDFLRDNFSKTYHAAFLLGLDPQHRTAYITAHNQLATHRPETYASPSALPIPLPSPTIAESALIEDVFEHVYGTPTLKSQPLRSSDASLVTTLLPTALCRFLEIDHITANSLAADLLSQSTPPWNRAAVILRLLHLCNIRIAATAITESPTTSAQHVTLTGILYVDRCIATLYNEKVFSSSVPVVVDAHFAVALAHVVACTCFITTDLFNDASQRIHDMSATFASCGRDAVTVAEPIKMDSANAKSPRSDKAVSDTPCAISSEQFTRMTASDVLSLSDEQLRALLRRENVAVFRKESRESLLGKFVDFMDEVQRRELGIMLAAQNGMYALAAQLQKGRSRRGRLLAKLHEAEDNGDWEEALRYATDIERLERQTHDTTAEPGSYDRNLDQDDWYRPNR